MKGYLKNSVKMSITTGFLCSICLLCFCKNPVTSKGEQIIVNNKSKSNAYIYIDRVSVSMVGVSKSKTFKGDYSGSHDLYAETHTGLAWWGPMKVTIDKNGSYTWNLLK